MAILEIIQEQGRIAVMESDDLDQRIEFPAAALVAIIENLQSLQ